MLKFLKKDKKIEFSLEPLDEHCIPYACHYDDYTVLTKNGELMQVIKIEGYLEQKNELENDFDLRAVIRKAILENITNRKFSLWFHTIRRKRNLDSINNYSWTFAKDTHEAWAQKNYWRSKFVNELYITILYEGENAELQNNLALSFVPRLLKKFHLDKLSKNSKILENTVSKMFDLLKQYGGTRLKVNHDRFGAHSEIMEFLTKITCLRSKRIALPIQSLDKIFSKTKIAFGGNCLEVIDDKEKHFAAVFTIKEYHEFASKALDKFLRISSEYVISQTLNFVDSKEAKKDFEYLDYILTKVSKDEEMRIDCGLAATMESDKGNLTDYASQQMTITIMGETLEELQRSVISASTELKKLGIVIIREDLHMALVFWSQLPGNFSFFRRSSHINTSRTASFASLHNTPSGERSNIWGSSITLFRRENGSPHFFNLHVKNNGNTMIIGPGNSSKNTLTNFLISEMSKYDPNILYIDQFKTSQVTLKALGGRYETIKLEGEKACFSLNPFSMADIPENRVFLKNWILLLIFPSTSYTDEQKDIIFKAIDELFANIALGSRRISSLLDFIEDETIKSSLSLWCKPNKFGLLFDNDYDEIGLGSKILGINIENLMLKDNTISVPPFVSYCMHQYNQTLDKTPAIICINDVNQILKDKFFLNMLPEWLDNLTNNNAIAILVCSSNDAIEENIKNIQEKISTLLFLPELSPKLYQQAFQLTDNEVSTIKAMKVLYRHFLIKQNNDLIVVELNLDGMDYTLKALNGGNEAIEALEKAIAETGDNPNRWIVPFYKNLFPELH